jgi:hypothetical protein
MPATAAATSSHRRCDGADSRWREVARWWVCLEQNVIRRLAWGRGFLVRPLA